MKPVAIAGMAMSAVAGVVLAGPAEAAIKCVNGSQVVQGNLLATPYCQDKLLADVARTYGMKVSFAEIRNNPNTKRYVCSFVGRDIRVHQTCLDAGVTGRRGF
jgi:hypothetical protein